MNWILFVPLVVLDLLLDLLGEGGESLVQLVHRGVLGDADALVLLQLSAQVLQVSLGQVNNVLGNRCLRNRYVATTICSVHRKVTEK